MRTFRLEKLVHDGIVEDHQREGCEVDFEVLSEGRRLIKLRRKLEEERAELAAAETDEGRAKEQGDVWNVLHALGELTAEGFKPTKLFEKGHYIHTVSVPEASWLAEYYGSDPVRFPEVAHD